MTLATRVSTLLSSAAGTRLSGGTGVAAGPAPLDGLSSTDRDKIVHGHWIGGQPFSDISAPWFVGKRSSDSDTEEISSLAQLAAWSAGTTGKLYEIRDTMSGSARHLSSIGDATMATLYAAGSPILAPNGSTLAAQLVVDSDSMAYARSDIMGLSGTGALQIISRASVATDVFGFCTNWAFSTADEATWHLYLEQASDDTASNDFGHISLQTYPSTVWAYWGYDSADVGAFTAPSWVDVRKAVDGTAANIVAKWNGADPIPARVVGVAGTYSLTGATRFSAYGYGDPDQEAQVTADAMIVLNAQLSAPGQAIVDAFFASLVTP